MEVEAEGYDMEITPERARRVREALIRLWEDQHGAKVVHAEVLSGGSSSGKGLFGKAISKETISDSNKRRPGRRSERQEYGTEGI